MHGSIMLPREKKYLAASKEFLLAGGDGSRGAQLLNIAMIELADGGRAYAVGNDRPPVAPISQPDRGGAGHCNVASVGRTEVARPVREQTHPKPSKIASLQAAERTITRSIFDTYTVVDGRGIGNVRMGEARRLRNASRMDAWLLDLINDHAPNAPSLTLVRDVVSERQMQKWIDAAKASAA